MPQPNMKGCLEQQNCSWVFLCPSSFFFGKQGHLQDLFPKSVYSLSTSEPGHGIHLRLLKLLKNFFVLYLSSESQLTKKNSRFQPTTFSAGKTPLFLVCNVLHASLKENLREARLHLDFTIRQESSQPNRWFGSYGVSTILGEEDCQYTNIEFPFLAGYLEKE